MIKNKNIAGNSNTGDEKVIIFILEFYTPA